LPRIQRDEVKPEIVYYPVLVRTDSDVLVNKAGQRMPIVPGMVATTDIRTGRKTVWDYLTKPLNKAREALRELKPCSVTFDFDERGCHEHV
jgi:adhesin transport system membrane fusion protein